MAHLSVLNVSEWIETNRQFFIPPVCNKLMHATQLNVMFVGGPNRRNDYHIESGEELFFQIKGDMILKVVEQNQHRDIAIKEGEIFLLPRAIPHSPQRFADTFGLVLERSRTAGEYDGLRFFVTENGKPTTTPLFESWFDWEEDRGKMAQVFDEFYKSEQYKTGKPLPGTIPEKSPVTVDSETVLQRPYNLFHWIENNQHGIDSQGKLALFDTDKHQLQVYVYGKGDNTDYFVDAQTWIWQLKGNSSVKVGPSEYALNKDDSLLVPAGQRYRVQQEQGSLALVCSQVPYQPNEFGQHMTQRRS